MIQCRAFSTKLRLPTLLKSTDLQCGHLLTKATGGSFILFACIKQKGTEGFVKDCQRIRRQAIFSTRGHHRNRQTCSPQSEDRDAWRRLKALSDCLGNLHLLNRWACCVEGVSRKTIPWSESWPNLRLARTSLDRAAHLPRCPNLLFGSNIGFRSFKPILRSRRMPRVPL
jgi:hypothetical protein